jgi:hypothetical protein
MSAAFFKTPYPGMAIMIGGLIWDAVSNAWSPKAIYVCGSAYAIAALLFENWHLRVASKARLRLVFDRERGSPFVRNKPLFDKKTGQPTGDVLHIFSVGITNSGETVDGVSVKLMRIEPPEASERWGLSLRVLDSESDEKFAARATVHRSPSVPVVYYELLTQEVPAGGGPSKYAALRLADKDLFDRVRLGEQEKYFITLAISGMGADAPQRFVLQKNERGCYEMRPAI